jgi:nitroreductase
MGELERLIEARQRRWLVRKYVNPTNPPSLRPSTGSEELEKKPAKALQSPRSAAK